MSDLAGRRRRLAREQDGICPWCSLPFPEDLADTRVDHIIPRARGGPDVPWNRRLLHRLCNYAKGAKLTDEAVTLAGEHEIILHEPGECRKPRRAYSLLPLVMYPRKCHGCGCQQVAMTDDPEVRILCGACYSEAISVELAGHDAVA